MRFEKTLMATTLAAVLAVPATASAQEVEQLKAQMQELMERIEQLERQEAAPGRPEGADQPRRAVGRPAADTQRAVVEPSEPSVVSGTDKVRVALSGHINRAVLAYDDGENSDVHHVDNENSNTRFRIVGEYDTSPTFTVGTVMEVEFESNSSSDVVQNSRENDHSDNNFAQRKFEIFFADDNWGRLSLG